MRFSLNKYNSLILALYIFYPVPNLLYIYTDLTIFNPVFFFLLLFPPVLLSLPKMSAMGVIVGLFVIAALALSVLISDSSDETLMYTLTLVTSFTFPAIILAASPLDFDFVKIHLKWLSITNLALLLYMAVFRSDIYLDRDIMNYMSFGYWSLTSFLVFSFLYFDKGMMFSLPLLIISFFLLALFGSKFASVSAVLSFTMIFYYYRGFNVGAYIFVFVVATFIVVVSAFAQDIILVLIPVFESIGFTPINLYRTYAILSGSEDSSTDERLELYKQSLQIISNNPFGVGIYGYHRDLSTSDISLFRYPHNLVIQLALEYGILGASLVMMLVGLIIYEHFSTVSRGNGWIVIVLICMCSKLAVTGNYMWEPAFWMMLVIGLRNLAVTRKTNKYRVTIR